MLTDTACKKTLCPADKLRLRLADSGGLYLQIEPSGSRRWFWKYRFDGKEKRLALGSYPEVTLKAARTAPRRCPQDSAARYRPRAAPAA